MSLRASPITIPAANRGGNLVMLKSGNLHSYWDSRIGTGETDRFLNQSAATIQGRHPKPDRIDMSPETWVKESFELRRRVYGFTGIGTEPSPAVLSDQYSLNARTTAFARAAIAGFRLAQFLKDRLR